MFNYLSSDNHLRSLLTQQANQQRQVLATIVGGDSYSLFTWDWYERMLELSNDVGNCHCFVIAIDEIDVILAIKQGVPVYYSTFSFDDQIHWTNVIEAKQHLLYREGHAKFQTTAKIVKMGYSVLISETDVFWMANPFDQLKQPLNEYDLQISDHSGSHARINIGIFFARSTKASSIFFAHVAQFWIRYGKGTFITDQRVLDAMLNNYDRLKPIYQQASGKMLSPPLNWTTHFFGHQVSHMMVDGGAFYLFKQAAQLGMRSKKFYGGLKPKFFTVRITDKEMKVNERNLILRALLILQQSTLLNRTLILPAFTDNLTVTPLPSQLDIRKFLLYWTEKSVRLPDFIFLAKNMSIPVTSTSFVSTQNYDDIVGILDLSLDSIPLNLVAPSPEFEVSVRDSMFWCSPPTGADAHCTHHSRGLALTAELLFSCGGDSNSPCIT
ncbi:unnamed protein product [Rotaria magnacalcarata]|uniref:Nucleotide-diphospho-sugar transferase domain-containing protein n=1 Tax=Rotaria magnacalcarata TaxID=392030 RepID=A0A816KZL4_9BILA|nr:unnamed protein product [Rotaria magnacalcarata]CAF2035697.1 unnamed protein product [Rotaria magnacalcarata]CAF3802700.1 unnamed protein product [Rotaria magnacalcarata]CAF3898061.1 unnamed protein product [Rotaria magnacalcarata]